jgi:integrase
MAITLTAAAVAKFRPTAQRREIRDGGASGLYLVVQPSGAKSWAMRFRRPSGKSAKLHLGTVDLSGRESSAEPQIGVPLTLAAARQLAAEVGRQRLRGIDPAAEHLAAKRRARADREERARSTFAAAAEDFVREHAMRKVRRWPEIARLLGLNPRSDLAIIRGGLADRWREKPITEIDGHDVHGVIEETRRSGAPGLQRRADGPTESRARAMMAALSKMFGWLAQKRPMASNPCAGVHRPEAPAARDRVLNDHEIVLFWRGCEAIGEPFDQLLKLLLLTGCRVREVAGMSRAELSEDGATWSIPAGRTKNRRPHVVPLSPLARDLLAKVRPVEGRAGVLFTTNGERPVSGFSKIKRRLDRAMLALARKERGKDANVPPWRLHDLRRTMVTGMNDLGVMPHVVEAAVNHVSGFRAGVAGVYNKSQYLPERKAALERWAQHVQGLVSPDQGKVVDIRKRKRGA